MTTGYEYDLILYIFSIHEPASIQCTCGCQLRCINEDVSEKLNFRPAQFYKEQHVRGKWVCDQCDTLTQQAMPAYVIEKGIATPELLSHVLVSKYADHLPLYRQRAANIMTLVQSAKLNGLDPYAYLSDMLRRLPLHKVTELEDLLPHRWAPEAN